MPRWSETKLLKSEPTDLEGAWYMELEGALDGGETLQQLESEILERIEQGIQWLILDVAKVKSFVDMGHGRMVVAQRELAKRGGGLAFVGMCRKQHSTFEMLGLSNRFHFFDSRLLATEWIKEYGEAEGGVIDRGSSPEREVSPRGRVWQNSPLTLVAHVIPGHPGCLRIELIGALDATNVIWFEQWLKKRLVEGFLHFFWDLGQCKYINETGLSSFQVQPDNFEKLGQRWAVYNIHPKVKVVFDMLGLTSHFDLYDTLDEALSVPHETALKPHPEWERRRPGQLEFHDASVGLVAEATWRYTVRTDQYPHFDRVIEFFTTPLTRFLILDVSELKNFDTHVEKWLVQWGGKFVRRGGCVALAGLKPDAQRSLRTHGTYSVFEHYPTAEAARHSIESVIAKEPCYVYEARRHEHIRTITLAMGKTLGERAQEQVQKYLDDFLNVDWLRFLVLDLSNTKTLAPQVELQITRAASALKDRGGLLAVAGMSDGLRKALGADGGDKLYMYFASPEGARDFIEEEFLHE